VLAVLLGELLGYQGGEIELGVVAWLVLLGLWDLFMLFVLVD
jgi:hypothetical protein